MKKKTAISWISLGASLLAGAAVWLSVDAWKARTPADPQESDAMNRQTRLNTEAMQDTLSDRLTGKAASVEQERLESALGLALFRSCTEWTDFHDSQPSDFSRANKEQACSEFRRYIETGVRPE